MYNRYNIVYTSIYIDISTMTQDVLCTFMYCIVKKRKKHALKQGISACLFPGIRKLLFHTPHSQVQDLCTLEVQSRLVQQRFLSKSEGTARFEVFYCHPDGSLQRQWDQNNSPKGEMHMLILNMTAKEVNNANSTSRASTRCIKIIHSMHDIIRNLKVPETAKIGQDEAETCLGPQIEAPALD